MTEKLLKTALNPNQSINQIIILRPTNFIDKYLIYIIPTLVTLNNDQIQYLKNSLYLHPLTIYFLVTFMLMQILNSIYIWLCIFKLHDK